MRTFVVISTILSLLCIGYGQHPDACGNTISSVTPFNIEQYTGDWASIAVNKAFFDAVIVQNPFCTAVNYALNEEEGTINITNIGFTADGERVEEILTGIPTGPNIAEFLVGFGSFFLSTPNYQVLKLKGGSLPSIPYRISLIYGCQVGQNGPFESLSIIARTRRITNFQYLRLLKFAKKQGIDVEALDMVKLDQTNCDDVSDDSSDESQD